MRRAVCLHCVWTERLNMMMSPVSLPINFFLIGEVSTGKARVDDFSFTNFLKEKFHDGHFNQDSLPLLAQFLTAQTIPQLTEGDDELVNLQNQCIKLMQENLPKEALIQNLQEIVGVLQKKFPDLELTNDLNFLLNPCKHQIIEVKKKWCLQQSGKIYS